MADDEGFDVARPARTLVRWILTVGAAGLFAVLVFKVSLDVWVGKDPTTVNKLLGGVMNSLAITFGSAFVGWFGLSTRKATLTSLGPTRAAGAGASESTPASGEPVPQRQFKRWQVLAALMTNLAGAAVLAMVVYLGAGAFAGVTYVFNSSHTPTFLITVATAWAAQASAVVASTLAAILKPEEDAA
jgi:hypothetical protein